MAPAQSTVTRIRFRRAVTLMLMTLVLPGSAQLVSGRKEIGRAAIRIWLTLLGLGAAVLLTGLVWHSFLFWLASSTVVLGVLRLGLMALAIGWAYLFVDAWRLGDPLALRQKQRLAMVGINGVLCFSVAGALLFASHLVTVQKEFVSTMFGSGQVTSAHAGRFNVLLLGGDSGSDRWGLRPDSITVASIDAESGKTVLFGLPRNMLNFPFPKGSLMAEQFPNGYDCGGECELNSLATWAADHKDVFTGVANPAVEATAQGVEGITGLKINYFAMVNLQGFRSFVRAVGGVTLNVRDRIPIGGIGSPVSGYIEPGVRKLNGYQALWFARSRVSSDDYSRMARQKCVLGAMLAQLSPRTVMSNFEKIAKASESLITTDVPASELDRFMELALKARSQPVRTVSFVPPMINTSSPDIDKVRSVVTKAIARSEDRPGATPRKPSRPAPSAATVPAEQPGTTGGSLGNLKDGYAANQASDLASAC